MTADNAQARADAIKARRAGEGGGGAMSEWKPGDVAMVTAANRRDEYPAFYDGKTWHERGCAAFCVDQPTSHRPLLVLDPESAADVKRLMNSLLDNEESRFFDTVQAALREFANPTPPKPGEPRGLGAVVEVVGGELYVRPKTTSTNRHWKRARGEECSKRHTWDELQVVRVLSEGVEAAR